jgi:hypothetical protein
MLFVWLIQIKTYCNLKQEMRYIILHIPQIHLLFNDFFQIKKLILFQKKDNIKFMKI